MATRIVVVVLTLLVNVLVSTSTAQTLDSNGCVVDGGVYDEVTKRCQCKPGYDGIGDLRCVPDAGFDVCFVKGDPTLRSVNDQRVSLNVPCAVCVNVMQGTTQDNKACLWEVLSSTTIHGQGAMYNSIVNIALSINKKSPIYITFDGSRIYNPVTNTDFNLDPDGKASVVVEGETLQLSYDESAEIWTMEGCQNRLLFRPKKDGVSGSPGIFMQSTKGSSQMTLQQGNLCNLQPGFDDSIPWSLGVLNRALLTRLMFTTEQKTSHPDYEATCDLVDDLMSTLCHGISDVAMEKCGPILYAPDVRYCLDTAGTKGKDMAGLFQQCLETFCDGEKTLCDNFKSIPAVQLCVPSLTECSQWPYYFTLK